MFRMGFPPLSGSWVLVGWARMREGVAAHELDPIVRPYVLLSVGGLTLLGCLSGCLALVFPLQAARAWAVAGYLEFRNVSFDRMDVSGAGSTMPLDPTEPDDPDNERVEIRLLEGA